MMRIFSQRILNQIKNNYRKILPFNTYQTPMSSGIIVVSFWGLCGLGYGIHNARKECLKSNYFDATTGLILYPILFIYHIGISSTIYSLATYAMWGNGAAFLSCGFYLAVVMYGLYRPKTKADIDNMSLKQYLN